MEPRFYVGSLTGYYIGRGGSQHGRKPAVTWYVYDRAYCHKLVRTFTGRGGGYLSPEFKARDLAEKLNEDPGYLDPPTPRPDAPKKQTQPTLPKQPRSMLLGRAWFVERRRRQRMGLCAACGVPVDEWSKGCEACRARHWYRERP